MAVPKYDDLYNPLIKALHSLGGSGSIVETEEKVAETLHLSEKDIKVELPASLGKELPETLWCC